MKPIYGIAVAALAMAMLVPAYGASDPLGALPNEVNSYLTGIVQFFENIVSSVVQAINGKMPA